MTIATRTDPERAAAPRHPADSHDTIRVQGARENNLKDVSVSLPKRRLAVFTGVSGSGKSSLVFDTIAAESQRMINETYPAFVQGFMSTLARPEVDHLEGLTTAIIVDQERMTTNVRSTVGPSPTPSAAAAVQRWATPRSAPRRLLLQRALGHRLRMIKTEKAGARRRRPGPTRWWAACARAARAGVEDIDLTQLSTTVHREGAITVPGYTPRGWHVRGIRLHRPEKKVKDF